MTDTHTHECSEGCGHTYTMGQNGEHDALFFAMQPLMQRAIQLRPEPEAPFKSDADRQEFERLDEAMKWLYARYEIVRKNMELRAAH